MELTDSRKALCIETAQALKGSARRLFMARTVTALGAGGQRRAARERGWGRMTIRKGLHALVSGFTGLDAFAARGRKRVAASLPNLLPALRASIASQSQGAPQCRPQRLSPRLSAAAGRRPLLTQTGYADAALPTVHTITTKRTALGYSPQQVAKSQPQKKAQHAPPSATK